MATDPSPFRILRLGHSETAPAWTEALAAFDAGSATVLKRDGGSAVYRARMVNRDVVVKVREMRGLKERIKLWADNTRGVRHWNGAEWLMSQGIATARPYVLAIERRPEGMREWLVLRMLSGKTLLQHMADQDLSVKQEHSLARQLARQMYSLTMANRFNRDHKPSNLILVPDTEGFRPALIDCVGIRKGGHMFWRMFHALAVEPTGLGILPRKAIRARVIREFNRVEFETDPFYANGRNFRVLQRTRRVLWSIVSKSLNRHGNPTPVVNPLATPLR